MVYPFSELVLMSCFILLIHVLDIILFETPFIRNAFFYYHFSLSRISPTKIRHSIATHLTAARNEPVDSLAHNFMKNRPSTTAKFYIQSWNNRESLRMAMQCSDDFTVSSANESTQSEQSDSTVSSATGEVSYLDIMESSPEKVSEWVAQQSEQILKDFDELIFDDNLETALESNYKLNFSL